jgi:uncharacterized membrane protein (UPF0127 family)
VRISVEAARSPWQRTRGLIGRRTIADDRGMLFENCSSIHTFFMLVPIDVVFLGENNVVVRVVSNVRPWRLLVASPGARGVIELAAGAAERYGIIEGETIELTLR